MPPNQQPNDSRPPAEQQTPTAESVLTAPPPEPVAGSAATVIGQPSGQTTATPKGSNEPANPNSTQNTLHISEIRDGIVIMNDGTFRAVVMCQSINFDLMSPDEREAVEQSYQGFLNSLYFPIQIYMRSQKIDLSSYLEKLDKLRIQQESMLIGMLMQDYVGFLGQVAQETNIMDKKFYIIIGYPDANTDLKRSLKQSTGFFSGVVDLFRGSRTPHLVIDEGALEKAKTELRNRVNAVMQGLLQCGVHAVPLDTQELIELYYESYNPDTAVDQKLGDAKDLDVPMVTKGQGEAPRPNIDGGIES